MYLISSAKPTTYKIEKPIGGGFSFNGERNYNSIQEMLLHLREPGGTIQLKECLPPSEYGKAKIYFTKLGLKVENI